MKIWIHLNGMQLGPYEESQLPLNLMNPSTPVWYQGLENWKAAGEAPLTSHLFANTATDGQQTDYNPETQTCDADESKPEPQPVMPQARMQQTGRQDQKPPRPANYLVWSILLTVLCCNPIGILAIIYGTKVNSRYFNYDYEGANKASETTAWWLIITIVTCLIFTPLSILTML